MGKTIIRLTESDLHRLIKESVKKILRESDEMELGPEDFDSEEEWQEYLDELKYWEEEKNTYYVPRRDDPVWDEYVGMPYDSLPWFMKPEEIKDLKNKGANVVYLDDEDY